VKNKCERSSPVRPLGVEKTSRLRSRDPVASWVKCEPHGGLNRKMKSWTVSWLSLKTNFEPGLRGSRVMSGDWQRLHRVRFWGFRCSTVRGVLGGISSTPLNLASLAGQNNGYGLLMRCSCYPQSLVQVRRAIREIEV
jgi:hypothetical protein